MKTERYLRPVSVVSCVLAAIGPAWQLSSERAGLSPSLPYTLVERLTLASCGALLVAALLELIRPRVGSAVAFSAVMILWASFYIPALWYAANHHFCL